MIIGIHNVDLKINQAARSKNNTKMNPNFISFPIQI